jgi:antitoxin component of MazEF toxin-antitoxin module
MTMSVTPAPLQLALAAAAQPPGAYGAQLHQRRTGFRLDDLLAGMTPETFPDDVDFGVPVGKEI